jgi:agmatinase
LIAIFIGIEFMPALQCTLGSPLSIKKRFARYLLTLKFGLNKYLSKPSFDISSQLCKPTSVSIIGEYVKGLLADGKFPLGMGGEHLVSWPVIREVYAKYPELRIIHIDAHADLREHSEGEPLSHSTPIRKAAELMGGDRIYQFGIRSGTREEFVYARKNLHFHPYDVLEPLKQELPALAGLPVYVTIDIDVLDPSAAPGTGTAEAGGITSKELLAAVHAIAGSGAKIVGADVVEVAPVYDHSEQTQIVAAKLIREMLLGFV